MFGEGKNVQKMCKSMVDRDHNARNAEEARFVSIIGEDQHAKTVEEAL